MPFALVAHCRAGFEPEVARDLEALASAARLRASPAVVPGLGFVAATGSRAPASGRTLRWGVISGTAAAWLWLAAVLGTGHVPVSTMGAFAAIVVAAVLAVWATAGDPAQTRVASLVAGTVCTLWIVVELVVVASYAPARMIPDLAPHALTPADDLLQSRTELQDPYVLVFVVGAAIALALSLTSLLRHRRG